MTRKANRDPGHVQEKMQRIHAPHVADLNQLADEIAEWQGLPRGRVPYVDPDLGGVRADIFGLASDPGPRAVVYRGGSGLLSMENNDESAAFCHDEYYRVGVPLTRVVHWNAVPFPVLKGGRPNRDERRAAQRWLPRVLALLPEVRVIVLFGNVAEQLWREARPIIPSHVALIKSLHPSPQVRNRKPENTGILRDTFDKIALAAGLSSKPVRSHSKIHLGQRPIRYDGAKQGDVYRA